MKAVFLLLASAVAAFAAQPFAGRWDLTVQTPKETYPSWMEFAEKEGKPEVRIVGRVASVHPATNLKVEGGQMTFSTDEWFGKPIKVEWEMNVKGGKLTGTQKRADGVEGEIAGVRAPALKRKAPSAWGRPDSLFNGNDMSGWIPDNEAENHWRAQDGAMVNLKAGANIRTVRKFDDFRLHIEYNCPKGGNSGVYLRGRDEIQVEYEPAGTNDKFHGMGSLYGFIAPAVEVAPQPGQWETYDVTLVGRTVTVIRDGQTIIDNQEIPGITGGALDSHEGEPGPLLIQGDHTGGMKYRNITISVPQR
ncbi:MAG TPA: DUF1080 domain-containing protein [Bryobacteraceae bacterium]|nr:DUF1080 domain-containing protein [Bryobacteraceae bacterium]